MNERTSIILFGLTSEGKSTISNMLIQGDIHYESNAFEVNDTAGGVSLNVKCSVNDRFIVYDTIGLGEPSYGTVPHRNAVREIRNYFSVCGVPLNYIAYVKKKGRITDKDREMFKILKDIFTDGNQAWVEKNSEKLKNFGDYPIIPVDFPWSQDDDDDAAFKREKRKKCLQSLTFMLSNLKYEGIVLEVLSSNQKIEDTVARIIEFIPAPVVGTVYHLISAGVYKKLGKPKLANKRLNTAAKKAFLDHLILWVPY